MKKNKIITLSLLFLIIPISGCKNAEYDKLLAHTHTYDPSTLVWNWTEKSDGGFDVNASISCSSCEDSKEGHTLKLNATVKGPNTIKECGCEVEGEISYTASVIVNNITYYQSKYFITEGVSHELDDEILYSDDTYHWYQCKNCQKIMGKEPHIYNEYHLRENTFYYDRECTVCDHMDSYFSTDLFNDYLSKFDSSKITPFDKKELDEAKSTYETLSDEQKANVPNYQNVTNCYKAIDEYFAQWDIENGTYGSVFGNTIPSGHYTNAQGTKELTFAIINNTEKGACLSMVVNQEFSISEDYGFYASAFSKNLNYVTGVMYIYCPEESQSMNINSSSSSLNLTINLVKGWNRVDFNETQWNKLNTQTYSQIRFTFNNPLTPNEEKWLFTSAYGRQLDVSTLNKTIEELPENISELKPYRYNELVNIKNKYDSLLDALKSKVTNIEKVTNLISAYNLTYQISMSNTGAWYNMLGNTVPTVNLYDNSKNPNPTLKFATDSTERGDALTVTCVNDFTNDAGFYFDTNNFSIKYNGVIYKGLYIYIYVPEDKTIEIRNRINGDSLDTELIKSVNCLAGWNEITLSESDLQKMGSKSSEPIQNFLAFFFKGGLVKNSGTYKFAVPYGVKK